MRSNIGKRVLGLALVSALVFTAAGCGGKKTEGGEPEIKISMLDFFVPGEGVTKAMKPLLEQYLNEHPNIVLDEESVSSADLGTKVQTLAAGDELPDIFMIKGHMAETFVQNGKMYALNEALDSDTAWRDNFKDGVFSNFTIEETIYAIPFQVTNTCVFYNKDLLAKAGIDEFPKTWPELCEVAVSLKELGVIPIALGNKEKWNAESVIMSTLGNRSTGNEWYQGIRDRSGLSLRMTNLWQACRRWPIWRLREPLTRM